MTKNILTLCLIRQDQQMLLGLKKRGFGQDRWNGFGGKVSEGETIEEAARREVKEESGITVEHLEKIGVLEFENQGQPDIKEVHIFVVREFSGEPVETEEMRPQWFGINNIPFDQMWPDDKFWFPLFLSGKKFKGKFVFDASNNILEKELIEI